MTKVPLQCWGWKSITLTSGHFFRASHLSPLAPHLPCAAQLLRAAGAGFRRLRQGTRGGCGELPAAQVVAVEPGPQRWSHGENHGKNQWKWELIIKNWGGYNEIERSMGELCDTSLKSPNSWWVHGDFPLMDSDHPCKSPMYTGYRKTQ